MVEQLVLATTTGSEAESLIYLASPISSLAGEQREEIVRDCALIKVTAEAYADTAEPPWGLRVHVPCLESSPWEAPDISPEQVFDDNFSLVTERADALIVHGGWGGSVGAGQEFAWACAVRLPTLFLHKRGQPVSRQVQGTPIDLEIVEFGSGLELIDAIADYVRRRRHAIQTHATQRSDRLIGLHGLHDRLQESWSTLDPSSKQAAMAIARLHPRRVEILLSGPGSLRPASIDEVLALSGALGIDAGRHLTGETMTRLTQDQLRALETAAAEYEWTAADTLALVREAETELAKGGTRRFPLVTPDDWDRFRGKRKL